MVINGITTGQTAETDLLRIFVEQIDIPATIMGIHADRQADGTAKAKVSVVRSGRKPKAPEDVTATIMRDRGEVILIREIMAKTGLTKARVYRALPET